MPDTKLNWTNIREHLRKHLAIYAAVTIAALILMNLLWTMTTPRIPDDQAVLIYLAGPFADPAPLDGMTADLLARGQAQDPTLRSVELQGLMFNGPEEDYASVMLLMTRLATGEADAFLASPNAMDALVSAGACLPLDEHVAAGWLSGCGLDPRYDTLTDPDTGESVKQLSGFHIDGLTALMDRGVFDNRGACLAVAANGRNIDTTMKVLEYLVEDLAKAGEAP